MNSRIPELDSSSEARVRAVAKLLPSATIYVCGICGTGMAAVARLLKELGFRVLGSDKAFYPPMGEIVRRTADRVFEGYDAKNLSSEKIDLIVIGNSIRRDNPEVEYAFTNKLAYASMSEVFAALLIGDRSHCPLSVVVCGTHGKTTTSAAMATVLDVAGRAPGYFIGGVPLNLPASIRPVSDVVPVAKRAVVLEGDEYDSAFFAKWPKFHSYRPDIMLCTSIEFDHADIYQSLAEIQLEFLRLARRVPKQGRIVVAEGNTDIAATESSVDLRKLINIWRSDPQIAAGIVTYGKSPSADSQLLQRLPCSVDGFAQQLDFKIGNEVFSVRTRLTGEHNALNLLGVATVAEHSGLSKAEIIKGIEAFHGVKRRQERIFDGDFPGGNGIIVFEDFAHHPTAVNLTLAGIREAYTDRRIIAVFEPRSNTSRRQVFQQDYVRSFAAADLVFIREVADKQVYSNTGEVRLIDVNVLAAQISQSGHPCRTFTDTTLFVQELLPQLCAGDVIVLMSNGDFGGLMQILVDKLR